VSIEKCDLIFFQLATNPATWQISRRVKSETNHVNRCREKKQERKQCMYGGELRFQHDDVHDHVVTNLRNPVVEFGNLKLKRNYY